MGEKKGGGDNGGKGFKNVEAQHKTENHMHICGVLFVVVFWIKLLP